MNCPWFSHDMDVLSEISQPQCSLCKNEFECSATKCVSIHESATLNSLREALVLATKIA